MTKSKKIPSELSTQVMSLLQEVNGEFKVTDMPALVKLVQEYCQEYPELLDLIKVNEAALLDSFHKTGVVPPGVKIVQTSSQEGSNVTELKVLHSPRSTHD